MSENKLGGFDKVHENFEKNKEEFDAKEEKNAKIDFSKFSRTKGNKTGSKKFSSKLEVFLNKKKFLIIDWIIVIAVICSVVIVQAFLVVYSQKAINHPTGYNLLSWPLVCAKIGNIFAYVSFGLVGVPFIFLLIFFIVGVNGVYKSKVFHMWMYFIIFLCIVCMITCICLSSISIYYANNCA